MMCVRKELLQTLAQGLPTNTIRFGSKISAIHQRQDNSSIATLDDGSQILPKVIIGCDGGKVARVWIPKNGWMLYVSRVREFSAGPIYSRFYLSFFIMILFVFFNVKVKM
ncbi:hypothetical protein SUGI_0269980 [Cryptomeria japonica]|nr:hypothetical protein SUGI_0269980 [Cryptomeria japonica]